MLVPPDDPVKLVRLTVRNTGDETATVLIVSAPRTSGYSPMGWN